jgi:hypothetical protein
MTIFHFKTPKNHHKAPHSTKVLALIELHALSLETAFEKTRKRDHPHIIQPWDIFFRMDKKKI